MAEKNFSDERTHLLVEILNKGVFNQREVRGLVNSLVADDSDGKCGCRDVCGCHSKCGSGCDRVSNPGDMVTNPADIVAAVEQMLRNKGLVK